MRTHPGSAPVPGGGSSPDTLGPCTRFKGLFKVSLGIEVFLGIEGCSLSNSLLWVCAPLLLYLGMCACFLLTT
jgi:hypothetical protein